MRDFNAVYQALADRLEEALSGTVVQVLRTNRPWTAVDSQPALLVLESTATPTWDSSGLPPGWSLGAVLTLYSQQAESEPAPAKVILEIIAKIHDALKWREAEEPEGDGYSTTLGGLVLGARLSGEIVIGNVPENIAQLITEIPVVMELAPSE